MIRKAKYPGVCKPCGGRITVGQEIAWTADSGAIHTQCELMPVQAPPAPPPIDPKALGKAVAYLTARNEDGTLNNFHRSLWDQWNRHGRLSEKQVTMILKDIDKAMPKTPKRDGEVAVIDPGVYELNGVAYIVKPNRAKTRLYAKRIVEIGGTRKTEAGSFVAVEFEYVPGVIYKLRAEDRMTGARAKELTIRYGRCICCGRSLKSGESVEQGIGPVCVKSFPDLVAERAEIKARARAEARAA